MRFTDDIAKYYVSGIPMIGNIKTGFTIGLTSAGSAICDRMFMNDVSEEELREVDEGLLFQIKENLLPSSRQGDRIKVGYLHVTHACNMQCKGCYSFIPNRNKAASPSLSELCDSLDLLKEVGVNRLVISGGEPFLRDDLFDLVKYAKEKCGFLHITILTNGSLLREDNVKPLALYVSCISVSLDSYSDEVSSYVRVGEKPNDVLRACDLLRDAGIESHLVVTIHAKNYRDILKYKQLYESRETTVSFSLLSPSSSNAIPDELQFSPAELKELAKEILIYQFEGHNLVFADMPLVPTINTRLGCGAGCRLLSVSPEGVTFPCYMMHTKEFSSIEINPGVETQRFPLVDELECCSDCEYRYFCGGGCRARAFNSSGDIYAKDPFCSMFKAYYHGLFSTLVNKNLEGR